VTFKSQVSHADIADMSVNRVDDAAALRAELEVLEAEEREISAIRRKMHERIDLGFPTELLIQQEQKLSKERRALHGRIDALRAQLQLLEREG
jgi:hypothetical protein